MSSRRSGGRRIPGVLSVALVLASGGGASAADPASALDTSTEPNTGAGAESRAPLDAVRGHGLGGPTSVGAQLHQDALSTNAVVAVRPLNQATQAHTDFKSRLHEETGLTYGLDFAYWFLGATASPGEDVASGSATRFYGQWDVLGRDSGDIGGPVYKVEYRSSLGTDLAPQQLGPEVGYAGLLASTYSDAGWMLSNLYWKQQLWNNRFGFLVGLVDYTDYVDMYGLISPWTDFGNLVFANNPTIPALAQGLGAAVRYQFADNFYGIAGFTDMNGDPTDPAQNFDTFFTDAEYLKHVEVGWISSWERRYFDNIHLVAWHADSFADGLNPSGWGLATSVCYLFGDHWMPFGRFGYSDGGGSSFQEWAVSVGTGYWMRNMTDTLGVGLSWGRPSEKTFGPDLRDQYTVELYYRMQVLKHLAITPDIQVLVNPSLNPEEDVIGIFGVRARLAF